MSSMKSAFERAMEKAERLGSATEEEKLAWKWVPEGGKLAGEFLRDKIDLASALERFGGEERRYVLQGVREALAANISLPKTAAIKENVDKAVEGLKQIQQDDKNLEELAGRIQYVVTQYLQYATEQQGQAYSQLKQQMEDVLRQQGRVPPDSEINVESIPEFQQEWMRILGQIEQPYQEHLESFKREILSLR